MKRITGWKNRALVLVMGVAAVGLGAAPAAAQFGCADPSDAPEGVREFFLAEIGDDFGIPVDDEAVCAALTANFIKACTTAARDSVKCFQNLFANHARQRQIGCKGLESGDDAKRCATFAKDSAKRTADNLKVIGEWASEDCASDEAEDFFDVCMFGF